MIDNIQKLYKLAEIEKVDYIEDMDSDIVDYRTIKIDYPPFTSEKQLELIKWLAFEKRVAIKFIDAKWHLYTAEMGISTSAKYETFEQLLAEFICNMWQDLTEEQKEEVRGILQ